MRNFIIPIVCVVSLALGCRTARVPYGRSALDPNPVDSDGDLLTDFEETVFTLTDPQNADTDGDGIPDGWEFFSGLDPLCPDGLDGPEGDPKGDGITNLDRYRKNPDMYKNRGLFYTVPESRCEIGKGGKEK